MGISKPKQQLKQNVWLVMDAGRGRMIGVFTSKELAIEATQNYGMDYPEHGQPLFQ